MVIVRIFDVETGNEIPALELDGKENIMVLIEKLLDVWGKSSKYLYSMEINKQIIPLGASVNTLNLKDGDTLCLIPTTSGLGRAPPKCKCGASNFQRISADEYRCLECGAIAKRKIKTPPPSVAQYSVPPAKNQKGTKDIIGQPPQRQIPQQPTPISIPKKPTPPKPAPTPLITRPIPQIDVAQKKSPVFNAPPATVIKKESGLSGEVNLAKAWLLENTSLSNPILKGQSTSGSLYTLFFKHGDKSCVIEIQYNKVTSYRPVI